MIASGLNPESQLMEQQVHQLKSQTDSLTKAGKKGRVELEKAAKKFEGFMMSFMYKEMYKSIPKSNAMGNRDAEKMFMTMYMDEVSKKSSEMNNGIASKLMKQYEIQNPSLKDEVGIQETASQPGQSLTGKLQSLLSKHSSDKSLVKLFNDFDEMVSGLEDKKSSDFGMRKHPISKKNRMHSGIDFALNEGSEVKSPSAGKVVFAGDKGGYGNAVEVDHGNGITTLYAHLSKIHVKEGDVVKKNKLLGDVGSTGASTGPHLHFEVRKDEKALNPLHLHKSVI